MKSYWYLGVLTVLLGVQNQARADLVVNGSFETGDLTGWTDGGNTGWNTVVGGAAPGEGSFQVSNGAVGSFSLLSQTLATNPGTLYKIDAWVQNDGGGTFNLVFDGVTLFSDTGAHPYTLHTVFAVASTGSTVIQTQTRDDPGFIQFDGIHVNAVNSVPEPASMTMLVLGAGGLLGYTWRRRKKAVAA
jgi:hypothetical protein